MMCFVLIGGKLLIGPMVEDKLNSEKFTVLATVHHETTTGILNSLPKISQIGEKHNIVTMVDAMSSYAGIEIDLVETPVDYLISSSNKCIKEWRVLELLLLRKMNYNVLAKLNLEVII